MATTMTATGGTVSARERLLTTADRLFYAEGVHTVGIDRILAEADVAKATLYNAFGSKEGLVEAYLGRRRERNLNRIAAAVAGAEGPRDQVAAIFDSAAAMFATPGYRGCAFVAASAESAPDSVVESVSRDYRAEIRNRFVSLAVEAGAADPETLGMQLHLLYDGAVTAARMEHGVAAAGVARLAALTLYDAAI
jgi:AcrR family transcriptional regulator